MASDTSDTGHRADLKNIPSNSFNSAVTAVAPVYSIEIVSADQGFTNRNYLELTNNQNDTRKRILGADVDESGNIAPVRRLDENGKMAPPGKLKGVVIDGKYNTRYMGPFEADPILDQEGLGKGQDSPEDKNHLSQGDDRFTVFQGDEEQASKLYLGALRTVDQVNEQENRFSSLATRGVNGNTLNAELRENMRKVADAIGAEVNTDFDAPGWDPGQNENALTTDVDTKSIAAMSHEEVKSEIDTLERKFAAQSPGPLKPQAFNPFTSGV